MRCYIFTSFAITEKLIERRALLFEVQRVMSPPLVVVFSRVVDLLSALRIASNALRVLLRFTILEAPLNCDSELILNTLMDVQPMQVRVEQIRQAAVKLPRTNE